MCNSMTVSAAALRRFEAAEHEECKSPHSNESRRLIFCIRHPVAGARRASANNDVKSIAVDAAEDWHICEKLQSCKPRKQDTRAEVYFTRLRYKLESTGATMARTSSAVPRNAATSSATVWGSRSTR